MMFDILQGLSPIRVKESTGLCTDEPDTAIKKVLSLSAKRQKPVVILSGGTADTFDGFLEELGKRMHEAGFTDEQYAQKTDLLVILSGYESADDYIRELERSGKERRRILCISGFHRMDYDRQKTAELLGGLNCCFQNNGPVPVLVLNIPSEVYQRTVRFCPDLCAAAIRLKKDAVLSGSTGHTESTGIPEGIRNTGSIRHREPVKPWYVRSPRLLEAERDGMVRFSRMYGLKCEAMTLPGSGRLCWKLRMLHHTRRWEFTLDLLVLSPENFSDGKAEVGIVIENSDRRFTEAVARNRRCLRVYRDDPEFRDIFLIQGILKDGNPSAAAASLEGLRELLNTIRM